MERHHAALRSCNKHATIFVTKIQTIDLPSAYCRARYTWSQSSKAAYSCTMFSCWSWLCILISRCTCQMKSVGHCAQTVVHGVLHSSTDLAGHIPDTNSEPKASTFCRALRLLADLTPCMSLCREGMPSLCTAVCAAQSPPSTMHPSVTWLGDSFRSHARSWAQFFPDVALWKPLPLEI
jgi:hypothetical protein